MRNATIRGSLLGLATYAFTFTLGCDRSKDESDNRSDEADAVPVVEVGPTSGTPPENPAAPASAADGAAEVAIFGEGSGEEPTPLDLGTYALTAAAAPLDVSGVETVSTEGDGSGKIALGSGGAWSNAGGAWSAIPEADVSVLEGDVVLSVPEKQFWLLRPDAVGRSLAFGERASTLEDLGYLRNGLKVAADIGDVAGLRVAAMTQSSLLLERDGKIIAASLANGSLRVMQVTIPTEFRDKLGASSASAGIATGLGRLWVGSATGEVLILIEKAPGSWHWRRAAIQLTVDGKRVEARSLAMVVNVEGSGASVATGVTAIVDAGLFEANEPTKIEGPGEPESPKPIFASDVRPLADRYCLQCHDWASREDAWQSRAQIIAERMKSGEAGQPGGMPLIGSVPAQKITAEERRVIDAWLKDR